MKVSRDDVRLAGREEAAARLRAAHRVLALTGAGVSAESGVPTFRGPQGLWRQFRPEDLATPEAFARDPKLVWEWYAWRREKVAACEPNAAHHALAALDLRVPEFLLATQNVDGLHARAGSRRMAELHGSLWRVRCTSCDHAGEHRRSLGEVPPRCDCGALLRPDIVWFGEALPRAVLEKAFAAAGEADVVLVAGTSSLVYPAAALPETALFAGAFVIEVNPEPTLLTARASVSLRGRAADVLPFLLKGGAEVLH
ncbi:MAG TPA: NAD-dependent deacylase [Vicinamibacteria bacterium]|nr:NAD-dependent deacylase [Vicinamibacteria bacterium]